jgi:hypothetical protein
MLERLIRRDILGHSSPSLGLAITLITLLNILMVYKVN